MKKIYFAFIGLVFCWLNAKADAPTTPSKNAQFNIVEGNHLYCLWTNGNGARRILVAREGSPVTAVPVNGVDYNSSEEFGKGDALAPGQFVVADVASTASYIYTLNPSTTYYFALFEYNGTGFSTEYLQSPYHFNGTTAIAPSIQTSAIQVSSVTPGTATVNWTRGNGSRCLVLIKEGSPVDATPEDLKSYNYSPTFGSGSQLGSGNFTVYGQQGSGINLSNLAPGKTYYLSAFEFNGYNYPVYKVPGTTASFTTPSRPSVPASGIYTGTLDGRNIHLRWVPGNGLKRIVIMKKESPVTALPVDGKDYAESEVYKSGEEIAPGEFVMYDGNSAEVHIAGLDAKSTYHFRIYEYAGTGSSIQYLTSTFASGTATPSLAPTVSPGALNFTSIRSDYMRINQTAGNGTGRLMIVKKGAPVDVAPEDLVKYPVSQEYGLGYNFGNGNFAISADNFNNLEPGTTYYFASFEYNGNLYPVYRSTPGTASATTLSKPTAASTGFNGSSLDGTTFRYGWNSGNGNRRIVIARKGSPVSFVPADSTGYTASDVFGNGTQVAPGEFVCYDGASTGAALYGITPSTTYYFRVYEYNLINNKPVYLTTAWADGNVTSLPRPSVAVTGLTASSITQTSITLTCTRGNGSHVTIVARAGSAVTSDPSDGTVYYGSSTFGFGNPVGSGNYSLYRGTSNSVTITGLTAGVTYHFAAYESNGSFAPVYQQTATTASFSTTTGVLAPTVPSTGMTFGPAEGNTMRLQWTNGNGAGRIVVARAGMPADALPVDGTSYTANSAFGSGQAIAAGQYIVYNGTGNVADLTGLQKNITYHFTVYEYNGTGSTLLYLRSSSLQSSFTTAAAPTVISSTIGFTSVAATQTTINWTNGNGAKRIVILRAADAVTSSPADFSAYPANATFGTGTQVGSGNYVVYNGNGSNVAVTGLLSGQTYHVAIYEYNGSNSSVYTATAGRSWFKTVGVPKVQTSAATFSNVGGKTIQLNFTAGDGNKRIVIARKNNAVNVTPVDDVSYTASNIFGAGTQLGADNYVVYTGTGSNAVITGLELNSTYHFAISEFNDYSGGTVRYLALSPARGSITTLSTLPVHLSRFTASASGNTVVLGWRTESESNSAYFNVQHSIDGILFKNIQRVNAIGNSGSPVDYTWTDAAASAGANYYRLQMVDRDNSSEFSAIRTVQLNSSNGFSIYPNPASTSVRIRIMGWNASVKTSWIILNNNGHVVLSGIIGSAIQEVDIRSLPAGHYHIQLTTKDNKTNIQFIKL
ncbi:MAG: T9SS type A sorting domain-containing protein [Chitinophagaceae bacterium]|nr:MAG: T9SS type A sorting domain-containing protein [Chitinophagaceae bacterium]